MSLDVKICGLSTPETLDAAVTAGARWVGFVAYPPSPRHIDTATLATLGARVPGSVGRVLLSVDADDALLAERIATGVVDLLQLHGAESPARVAAIRQRFGKPVMKVAKVASASDIDSVIRDFGGIADRLMFDAAGGVLPGGNAQSFDWRLLAGVTIPRPWMLAGGLTAANVAEAARISGATTLDVSSGVESARGVKSAALIRAFIAAAQGRGGTT
ncbi:MAG: phosphoribosylanthranilate isomerase [Alphaproteobacteria bacterium]|nr:phosphoribosylanthranilate isomerase [Alphaproteobacteria bacterium]